MIDAILYLFSFPSVSFSDDGSQRLSNLDLRLLVALPRARDLLDYAKHLFVAAIDGWGSPGLVPNWQIRT